MESGKRSRAKRTAVNRFTGTQAAGARKRHEEQPPLVAIGGSAGSLDALMEFFTRMPGDCGLSFIVVLHLLPLHDSNLPEVLQRHSALRFLHARNNQTIQADHVYVIPPGRVLGLLDGRLQVAPLPPKRGVRTVIEVLFNSLAKQGSARIAGIVLSGADSDGAAGLMHIHQSGGLTLAQDPAEAACDVMPRAAMATGCVDDVLRVAQMPARLLAHFRKTASKPPPPAAPQVPWEDPTEMAHWEQTLVREVLACLRKRVGYDFSCYRTSVLARRIRQRMQMARLDEPDEYLAFLRKNAAEAQALGRDLLVSITGFFRDPKAYEALALFVPTLFNRKGPGDFVRVWVPGCATGEEAYSVAMLLLEHASTLDHPPGIQVFGCDLDSPAIQTARAGVYPARIASAVGVERLQRFFRKEPRGYRVRAELRQVVLFAVHDVVKDPAFARMDMVTCRNLLIYLGREAQKGLLQVFEFALNPQGLLFLGPAEGLEGLSPNFEALEHKHRIYCRRAVPLHGPGIHENAGATLPALAAEERARGSQRASSAQPEGWSKPLLERVHEGLEALQHRLQKPGLESGVLQAANQELQVMSQELRATVEELEINRQELQCMNEELSAVNQELSINLDQLGRANSDLTNLMNATAIPAIFLDRDLRIMRFTPTAVSLFRLIASDIGRPLDNLRHELDYPVLLDDLQRVLAASEPIETEVQDRQGRWFLARMLPYRSPEDRVSGVVLAFPDITERKRAEAALRQREEQLRQSQERLRLALGAGDFGTFDYFPQTGKLVWDEQMKHIWGLKPGEDLVYERAMERIHPEDQERMRQALAASLSPDGDGHYQVEFRVVWPDGTVHWHRALGRVYFDQSPEGKRLPICMAGVESEIADRE